MTATLDARLLLRESAPVAVVLSFWTVLSWLPEAPVVADGVRYAGLAMALLYVARRGVALADRAAPRPTDVGGLLRENARVALPAGAWFLAGTAVHVVEGLWRAFVRVGLFTTPAPSLAFVFAGTGVLTVVLYAVAAGVSWHRDGDAVAERDVSGAAPADD